MIDTLELRLTDQSDFDILKTSTLINSVVHGFQVVGQKSNDNVVFFLNKPAQLSSPAFDHRVLRHRIITNNLAAVLAKNSQKIMLVGKTLRKRFHVDKELSLAKLEASIYIAAERLEGRAFLQNYAETSYSVRASKQLRLQYLYCLSRKMEKHSHLKNIADQIQDVLGEALMPDFKFDDTKLQLIFS